MKWKGEWRRLVTVLMGSSGRPVAQSMMVCMPTKVAGMVSGLLRSAWETGREWREWRKWRENWKWWWMAGHLHWQRLLPNREGSRREPAWASPDTWRRSLRRVPGAQSAFQGFPWPPPPECWLPSLGSPAKNLQPLSRSPHCHRHWWWHWWCIWPSNSTLFLFPSLSLPYTLML